MAAGIPRPPARAAPPLPPSGARGGIRNRVVRCVPRALPASSEDLDASLLIMPLVFFMAPNDPRMIGTIDAILKNPRDGGLLSDSLVYRYPPQPRIDGLPGEEGTFNMCSFWLVEALTRAGQAFPEKLDQARLLFERVLGYANHLGLYAKSSCIKNARVIVEKPFGHDLISAQQLNAALRVDVGGWHNPEDKESTAHDPKAA
jgi:GH15 family glucan-1,4-alpha-glucosidase